MRTENIVMITFNDPISGNPKSYHKGISGVIAIIEKPAYGDGDKWFYDVQFENGMTERIFYPLSISFKTE